MGALTQQASPLLGVRFPRPVIVAALVYAGICLAWRYYAGQIPVPHESVFNHLFDKWQLGPLRLLNFFALLVLLMHYADWIKAHVPRIGFLEKMGAVSLPVFCVHLVVVLVALALFGPANPERPLWRDIVLFLAGVEVLYAAAVITLQLDTDERERMAAVRKLRAAQKI